MKDIMMKRKVFVSIAIILSLILGFFAGRQSLRHDLAQMLPPGVLDARLMNGTWDIWEHELRAEIPGAVREGIWSDNKEAQEESINAIFGVFEPMVFCHPFIILKRRDNSGYRVSINSNANNPTLDDVILPILDYRRKTDSSGAIVNEYTFRIPPRIENGEIVIAPNLTVFDALVRTDTNNNRKAIIVALENTATGDMFHYIDRDADGVFETIYHVRHVDGNVVTSFYSLTEFAEKFCNAN